LSGGGGGEGSKRGGFVEDPYGRLHESSVKASGEMTLPCSAIKRGGKRIRETSWLSGAAKRFTRGKDVLIFNQGEETQSENSPLAIGPRTRANRLGGALEEKQTPQTPTIGLTHGERRILASPGSQVPFPGGNLNKKGVRTPRPLPEVWEGQRERFNKTSG